MHHTNLRFSLCLDELIEYELLMIHLSYYSFACSRTSVVKRLLNLNIARGSVIWCYGMVMLVTCCALYIVMLCTFSYSINYVLCVHASREYRADDLHERMIVLACVRSDYCFLICPDELQWAIAILKCMFVWNSDNFAVGTRLYLTLTGVAGIGAWVYSSSWLHWEIGLF